MNRSLYTKLVAIMLVLILSLMTVVGALLMRGIRNFYINDFYYQMQAAFSNQEMVSDLRSAALEPDAPEKMAEILRAWAGELGINSGKRNYYILKGDTGAYLTGSADDAVRLEVTPNILTAITGREGYESDGAASYMDVALPIQGEFVSFIVYIKDNKDTVSDLSAELFGIILGAMGVGLAISIFLSLLLAKTMVTPIQSLTAAAERVAGGDFSNKLENPARDEIGELTRTFNSMADRLERTLDDLTKSESMRKEFVANVSHELRTPITNIRSYAETLSDAQGMPKETEEKFLQVIVNESDRMTNIVQDLLTLSKFDVGAIDFSFEHFSFEKSVRNVYSAMRIDAQKRGHEFSLEFKTPLPEILGDRSRIEQVLINMVSNAVKYTPDGGKIRITAGQEGSLVWCEVKDNGIGIPRKDADRVFDRFYRVDKARARESGGSGLGLSIAQEIVNRHKGKITLRSAEGKGTAIRVFLPVEGPGHAA